MDDISYSEVVQDILKKSGFKTSSFSMDEDGYSHKIEFNNEFCSGEVHTCEGVIIFIESKECLDHDHGNDN